MGGVEGSVFCSFRLKIKQKLKKMQTAPRNNTILEQIHIYTNYSDVLHKQITCAMKVHFK